MTSTNFFSEHNEDALFLLNRNERKEKLREILIESMRLLATGPLKKSELQKLAGIRRKTFLQLLAEQIQAGAIIKLGTGIKGDPHKYILTEQHKK